MHWHARRKACVSAKTAALQREMTLSEVLKAFGVAQATLAEALGVSQGEVSRESRVVYLIAPRPEIAWPLHSPEHVCVPVPSTIAEPGLSDNAYSWAHRPDGPPFRPSASRRSTIVRPTPRTVST